MLLAVDTSTAQMGLALYDGAQVLCEMSWTSRAHHTVELAPAVADLMSRCGVNMQDVQALGVALGPGGFTSLRVGLAFVKGLALARHVPVAGVPTFEVIAKAQPMELLPLMTVLQAGRGRLAVGTFEASKRGWQPKGAAFVTTAAALAESIESATLVAGELTPAERDLLRKQKRITLASPASCVRRPALLAELAWARWQAGETSPAEGLAPIYLHTPEGAIA